MTRTECYAWAALYGPTTGMLAAVAEEAAGYDRPGWAATLGTLAAALPVVYAVALWRCIRDDLPAP